MKINSFILVFIFVFLLRLFLFKFPSFYIDMNDWEAWSYRLVNIGILNFYAPNYFTDYFPGYLYILWIIGSAYQFIFSNLSFSSFNFEVIIKLITNAFDFGTAYFIYKIVNNYNKKFSKIAALFYLLNPAVIFNSSVWGQIDGIVTFFLIYSTYLLIEVKKPLKASLFYSIGILVKPQSLAIFPIALIYVVKSHKKNLLSMILIIFLIFTLLSIPFFINDPINGFINLIQKSFNVYPYTSLYAFNFWGIFGWWKLDSLNFFGTSYKNLGIILYFLSLSLIIFPLFKDRINHKKLYLALSLFIIIFYLFLTRMHERYLFPSMAFLLIAAFIYKSRLLTALYILISFVHFINLWFVYYFYDFIYSNPNVKFNFFYGVYKFTEKNHLIFSILSIVIFFVMIIYYYKINYEKNSK